MRKTKVKRGENLKSQKAITLIALVITIIVLLILAAISIATLTGENGILTQADNAKTKTKIADVIERAKTDILGVKAENGGNISESQLNEICEKYGTISGNGEDKILTTNDGYVIKVSDIYSGTLTGGGKIISDLYDGYNDPTDTGNYNENAMHIGDYVNYTAGIWTETKEPPTSSTPFTFGGYTSGQSIDTNATGSYTYTSGDVTYGEGKYEGWRIWDISEDKQTITLISAGCPEVYYHPYGVKYAFISEYILTGEVDSNANASELGLGSTYVTKDWNMYKNADLYATDARAMQKRDLYAWYKKYIDSSIDDSWDINLPSNTENKLISTVENGFYYWLCSPAYSSTDYIYIVNPETRYVTGTMGKFAGGVRVLVSLTSDVKFKEVPEKVEQDGFLYNKWIIE